MVRPSTCLTITQGRNHVLKVMVHPLPFPSSPSTPLPIALQKKVPLEPFQLGGVGSAVSSQPGPWRSCGNDSVH